MYSNIESPERLNKNVISDDNVPIYKITKYSSLTNVVNPLHTNVTFFWIIIIIVDIYRVCPLAQPYISINFHKLPGDCRC